MATATPSKREGVSLLGIGMPDVAVVLEVQMERTCTGADYHHKLAQRCAQLGG